MLIRILLGSALLGVIALSGGSVLASEKKLPDGKNKVQLIRNATMKITYAGKVFLTDPMLSDKGEIRSFAGIASNPTVELPLPLSEILTGVDAIIVSHTHPDHFHRASEQKLLNKKPLFCQKEDEVEICKSGFKKVIPVSESVEWEGITIFRVPGKHGEGEILSKMGNVSGFIFKAPGEPTIYWAGDTIWCEEVKENLARFNPDIVITHSGGATIPGFKPILMDGEQTIKLINSCPSSIIIAIHMESLDHCVVSRESLRELALKNGIVDSRLLIPADGEIITFK